MKNHRVAQAKYNMKLGAAYERNNLIFANDEGKPLHYGNLTKKYIQSILNKTKFGHFRLYSLRHTCATLLLAHGENMKVIQERLGHADVNLTLNTYSYVLERMQAQASDKLETLLYEKKKAKKGS